MSEAACAGRGERRAAAERRQRRGHVEGLDGLVATAAYQPEPTAAAAARRFVRDTLQTWFISGAAIAGHGLVDDAVLLTSELVTNAVVHAGTPVEVTCKLTGGGVEVVVSDGHPARLVPEPPENEHVPAERTSGRGLLLPAALASAWGVTYGRSAKAVWFRIGQPGSGLDLEPGGEREDGLRPVLDTGIHTVPGRGPGGQPQLAAVRSQAPAAPVKVGAGAPGMNGTHRWPVPPFGEPGYDELLASTVESARAAVGADAAYAMVPDEDGELRLRAAAGRFPSLASPAPAGDGLAGPGMPAGLEGHTRQAAQAAQAGQAGQAPQAGRRQRMGRVGRAGRTSRAQARRARMVEQARRAGLLGQPAVSPPSLAAVRAAAGAAPSVLTVPFVVDGRVTGLLAVESASADRFHDNEATRLQHLADRWGPTLERARLSELERVRRGRISALAQARGLLAGRVDTDDVLALAGETAVPRLVPWCAVLLPAEGMGLRVVYARHMDEDWSPALAWLLDRVAETAAGAEPPLRPAAPARPGPMWRWPLAVPGLAEAPIGADALATETAWCFPLGTGNGAGVLAVGHRREERLPRELAELATDLACRIGLALDNARLVSQEH
jgi:anti-sigma regulatory factor (Ser/Thr protein kinase)